MKKSVLLCVIALFARLVPASAGEVYVPFAGNKNINGANYATKVWVTNTGTAAQRCDVRFLAEDTDGTKPGTPVAINVPAGGTSVLSDIAPLGQSGMLEVSGPAQLVVTSRLEVVGPNVSHLASISVPVVSTANVIAASKTAQIQGLERTQRGTLTDFGILNLNTTTTQCTVKAYRSNGSQIAQTVTLSLTPLSVRHFDGALSALGENLISDVRIQTSCDKQFFPYALVYTPGGSEAAFITPSGTLDGDLVGGTGGNPPPGGTVTVTQPGVFLAARQGASYKAVTIPLVNGVQYKKATIEFDLAVGRFPAGLFAGVMSFRRNDRTLFFGMIIRGDREKTLLDLGVTDDILQGPNGGPWKEQTPFHVWYEYNTQTRVLTFKCYRNGALAQTLTAHTNHNDLSLNGKVMSVDFGMTGVADGAYFPPIGWTYSNLKVTVEP